jgi:S-adenosylmethionine decarboxylase
MLAVRTPVATVCAFRSLRVNTAPARSVVKHSFVKILFVAQAFVPEAGATRRRASDAEQADAGAPERRISERRNGDGRKSDLFVVGGAHEQDVSAVFVSGELPDLAPTIHRQRLVIEGTCPTAIDGDDISRYLVGLSDVCDMTVLLDPVVHKSERYGWAGWVHWEASGAHVYAWERPLLFFSVDIYTCKAFDSERVVAYTNRFFNAREIVSKAF